MQILKCSLVVVVLASMSVVVSASPQRGQRGGQPQPQQQVNSDTPGDATSIGRRLYLAVLGREADSGGLAPVAAEIQRGQISSAVDGLLKSTEFRNVERSKSASELLDQFYRGLLNRSPDRSGSQSFLPRMEARQYAGVIADITNSNEFRNSIAAGPVTPAPQPTPAPRPTPTPVASRLETAFACQFRVLELIRKDAGGRVLVSFDKFPDVSADGQTVQGSGNDRWVDGAARPMTYRCAGKDASYRFADGRSAAAPDSRLRIPSGSTRACQDAVQGGLVFDAAAISGSDIGQDWILGLAGGAQHECKVEAGGRVVLVK